MYFSIIIPCYNQREQIARLLDSLELQSIGLDHFEVIVSDDGSSDNIRELLESYRGPLTLKFILPNHRGCRARARNNAITQATGTHLLFLDGDMYAHPDFVKQHQIAHQQNTPQSVFIGKVIPISAQQDYPLSWYRVSRGGQKKAVGTPLPPRYFITNNASLSVALFKNAGPFDEQYKNWGGEDTDMGYALQAKGAKFYFLPEALSYHDHLESLSTYKKKLFEYTATGLPLLIKKRPDHVKSGYLRLFLSQNPGFQPTLSFLFWNPFQVVVEWLAPRLPIGKLSYRLYDYITYGEIFRGIRRRASHA